MVDHPRQSTSRTAPRQEQASDDAGGDRIAKVLARAGVASRRDVERLIEEGRVALNGQVLTSPAIKVGEGDIVTVDGQVVDAAEPTRLWRYHKPVGLITAHKDPGGRPTVFQNLPGELPRVISVGRLDLNSEGLLLLTNDGELARALEIPSSGWVRTYRARAYGSTTQAKLDRLQAGVTIDDVTYGPIDATLDKAKPKPGDNDKDAANLWITVSLTEGKNREVRKVLESIGLKVNRLIRLAYGPFALATLPVGAVEEVGPRVIREQLADLIPAERLPKGDRRPGPAILPDAPIRPQRRAESRAEGDAPRAAIPRRREAPAPVVVEKKEHKPGWAKAKRKPNPHAPAKDGAKTSFMAGPGPKARAKPRGTEIDAYPASHRQPSRSAYKPRDADRAPERPAKGGRPIKGAFKPGGGYNNAAKGPAWTRNKPDSELKDASGLTPYERAKREFSGAKPAGADRAEKPARGRVEGRPDTRSGPRSSSARDDVARAPRRVGPAWARPTSHEPEVNIKPWAERGSERSEDKPAKPKRDFGGAAGKPAAAGRPFGDGPRNDRPANDRPSGGKSFGGKPGGKTFAAKPGGRPSGPRADGGKAFSDKPRGPRPPPRSPKGGR